MNTLLQPGQHPDADHLSAFADHALPLHEQQQTLAHLATCPACRNLVYLAQQADPAEALQPQPIPTPRRWFRIWSSAWTIALPSAAALAALILLTIHIHNTTPDKPFTPTTTASVETTPPAIAPAVATPAPAIAAPTPPAPSPTVTPAPLRPVPPRLSPPAPMASAAAAAPVITDLPVTGRSIGPLAFNSPPTTSGGAITGTIVDPTGAIIPHAKITVTNTDTGVFVTRETTPAGDFTIPALQPGNYNVEASALGFQHLIQQNVPVAPNQQLALNMKLNVGATSETVTVTNAPPALDTANATIGGTIENQAYSNLPLAASAAPKKAAPPAAATRTQQAVYGGTGQANLNQNYVEGIPAAEAAKAAAAPATVNALTRSVRMRPSLPSHLPALSTVANARQLLALDTAGALFRSEDAGVTWHPVPTQWQGRATHLTLISTNAPVASKSADTVSAAPAKPTQPQTFELTTDTNTTYTSPDGQTWRRK